MEIDPAPQLEKTALINQLLSELSPWVETLESQYIQPAEFQPGLPNQVEALEPTPWRSPIASLVVID